MTPEIRLLVGEARTSYEDALRLKNDPWIRRGVADTNALLDDISSAREQYAEIIEQIFDHGSYDVNSIALLGWCHHRLGKNEKAIKTLISVVSRATGSRDLVYLHFDLALAMLAARHTGQGLLEYERGVSALSTAAPLRRRGLMLVARHDLAAALIDGRVEPDECAGRAFDLLDPAPASSTAVEEASR